jgi:hypothetical protein
LQRSNDNAACGHDSKFKPLVLGEIQAADDRDLSPRRSASFSNPWEMASPGRQA